MRARTSKKMQKFPENKTRNHVAVEMRVHLDKMCFHGSPKMDQATPKASRGRPKSTPEHARNVPGVSLERPKRIPGALRHPLERSKGAPERVGANFGRKMASLKSISEVLAPRGCVLAFSGDVSILRASIFECDRAHANCEHAEEILFNLFLKAPRLHFRRLHVGSLFYTIFLVAILQVHLVYIYIYIYIYGTTPQKNLPW